jgi:hypothetical protein
VKWAITGAVAFVAAYAITIVLYASTGVGRPEQITDVRRAADGTTVTIDVEELHSVRAALGANLTVSPGKELLDPVAHTLKDDLSVAVTSEVTTKQDWSKGMVPGVLPVPLAIYGDPSEWPFTTTDPRRPLPFRWAPQTMRHTGWISSVRPAPQRSLP